MSSSPALLALQDYTGASTDTTAVMNYLESMNTLSGHSDPADEAQIVGVAGDSPTRGQWLS